MQHSYHVGYGTEGSYVKVLHVYSLSELVKGTFNAINKLD